MESNKLKNWSLIWSFILILIFVFMLLNFNEKIQYQYLYNLSWINLGYNFKWGNILLGIDSISLLFIGLSLVLIPVCILSSWNSINFLLKEFMIFLLVILLFLVTLFSVIELISFYILFEVILIPVFLMIGIWGSREEKIEASFYFFFYTLIGSFLMLLSIFKIYSLLGQTNFIYINHINIPFSIEFWLFIGFFLSLSVKIPMVPFHLWLPKAHVEAPIAGSVLLAGILLKLGGYGFLKIALPLMSQAFDYFAPFIIMLSLTAIIYGALSTLRQNDLKKLIAYSSVSHMGIVTLCLFTNSIEGLISSILMMLAHGLVSSAMFISTYILYVRHHSRIIKYYKGLTLTMPLFSSLNLVLILANIGFPLSLNFISEFLAIKAAINYSLYSSLVLCLGSFLTLIYSLYLYNRLFFGSLSVYLKHPREILRFEFSTFLPLILLTLLLGIKPNLVINLLSTQLYFFNSL